MAHLLVYKASAGSGKTYTLAREYLLHLVKDPYAYRKILAVTFTNKATQEMKSRIMMELNNIATGKPSFYLQSLAKQSGFSISELEERAKLAFTLLLHDYSRFSVMTIDKFFHQVLQSFTREIGLYSGFNLELDETKILGESVDEMLFRLSENPSLIMWLIDLAEAKIEAGKSWNYKQDLQDAGKEIFKEKYKMFSHKLFDKLDDKKLLERYISDLRKIIIHFERTLKDLGRQGMELIGQHDLITSDFKHGSTSFANYFRKLYEKSDFKPGARPRTSANDLSSWYTGKSEKKERIITVYNEGLNQVLTESIDFYDKHIEQYNSAKLIIRNIYTLGTLTDLHHQVLEYCREKNIFLISEMGPLLKEIIDENDAPFIYEKTGNIFHHFMIDEFQDTSRTQWQNFKPLVLNSLSQDYDCMVVGDVKQSIYRWRNSDWKILSEQLFRDFPDPWTRSYSLDTNWRSNKYIIHLNNLIFHEAAALVEEQFYNSMHSGYRELPELNSYAEHISKAYEDVIQKESETKDSQEGYIRLKFFPGDEKEWREHVKEELPGLLRELFEKGYSPGDIAILVREGKEGRDIMNALLGPESIREEAKKHQFDIISNDALYLENSVAVLLIISVLKYLVDRNDRINCAFMLSRYNQFFNPANKNDLDNNKLGYLDRISHDQRSIDDLIVKTFPDEFIDSLTTLSYLPLFEVVEHIVHHLKLNQKKNEISFVQAFLDIVLEFSENETSDIRSFLEYWKKEGSKKTIAASEEQDAVRVLTIHKAKGLEFPVVIIPYCHWTLDHDSHHQNIIWCQPEKEPFNALDLIPVNYSSRMEESIFRNDYYSEKLHAYIDNLNLLYVAFTRAINSLYVFTPAGSKNRIRYAGDLLYQILQGRILSDGSKDEMTNLLLKNSSWNDHSMEWTIGKESGKIPGEENIEPIKRLELEHPVTLPGKRLRLALHKTDYFELDDKTRQARISRGNLMHELFERVITADDIDQAIERLVISGKISGEEKEQMRNYVLEKINDPLVSDWFTKKWKVKTESDILVKNEKIQRPDRVMIKGKKAVVVDYKFGEVEEESYLSQLRKYIRVFKRMGYTDVTGFIWYVELNRITEVFV